MLVFFKKYIFEGEGLYYRRVSFVGGWEILGINEKLHNSNIKKNFIILRFFETHTFALLIPQISSQ